MFSFSNIVYINRKKYIYTLDENNNKLILISMSKEINEYKLANELFGKWIFLKGDELSNFSVLLGHGNINRGNLIFDIKCLVRYFPDYDKKIQKPNSFKSICFSTLAIDYFIGHKDGLLDKAINILSRFKEENDNRNGVIEKQKKHKFIYKGIEYEVYFMTIGRFEYEKRFPFNIFSTLNIESSKSISLDEMYDLICLVRLFLQFISNRRCIDIEEIFTTKERDSLDINGMIKIDNLGLMEPSKWHIIPYSIIKENLGNLLQEIADNNICFRSLFNYEKDAITTVDIMNICACFESQFDITYPDFKNKTFKRIKKEIVNYVEKMPNNYNDSELHEMNSIINGIRNFSDTLKSKLQYALEDFVETYEKDKNRIEFDFGKNYIDMPNRLKNARNALDHGNTKYQLSNINYYDVELVRAIIYMMILKKINMPNEQIGKCVRIIITGFE